MTKITPSWLATVLLMLGLAAAPARASCNPPLCTPTFARTYVSAAGGSDGNTCGFGAPCRTFQRAHDQTLDQGEITVLDPGEYGMVTITKSISIANDGGGAASIQVSGKIGFEAGVTVNGNSGAYVNLRGLTIEGVGLGYGIVFNSGFSLTVTKCLIRNHVGDGIFFNPLLGKFDLAVSDTVVADNGGNGISIAPAGTLNAVLNRVEVYNNNGDGILVEGQLGGVFNVTIADSVAANNGVGLRNDSIHPFTMRVAQSVVTGNAVSWEAKNQGILLSYGDNKIDGNGDGNPAPSTIGKK